MGKLTAKKKRFIQEYLVDCNGAGAARRAGYSERSAREIAYALLQEPEIRDELAARRAALDCDLSLSHLEACILLTQIARNKKAHPIPRIQAIAELAKLKGWDQADEQEGPTVINVISLDPL